MQNEFWGKAVQDTLRLPSDLGREWTMLDGGEVEGLLNAEAIALVDAVTVTDRNATYEDAVQRGYEYFRETTGANATRRLDVVVDVCASRRAVQPL